MCTNPKVILTSPPPPHQILMTRIDYSSSCNLNFSTNFTCPLGKFRTELTNQIANPLAPTTFFACY